MLKRHRFLFLIIMLLMLSILPVAREEISLDGIWNLSYDGIRFNNEITVPGMLPIDPENYPEPSTHEVWYKKSFYFDGTYKRAFLKFYAVDNKCEIYVNENKVYEHSGGFDSFDFEITSYLKIGNNEIKVQVKDLPLNRSNYVIGKQDWYGNCVGIWQGVKLIYCEEKTVIKNLVLKLDASQVNVNLTIDGNWNEVNYSLLDGDHLLLEGISTEPEFNIVPPSDIAKWSFENPKLYTLELKVLKDGKVVDKIRRKIGFRRIEIKNEKIVLNGRPIYVKGLLDQDFWPETGYVISSKERVIEQFTIIKRLGFNLVRYHVKIPPKEYVEAADEVGIILWVDLPYARRLNNSAKNYLEELVNDLKERYSGNPSFLILTLINESWGLNLNRTDDRTWLKAFWQSSKETFPDRLVVDNSPCFGNYHINTDINDYHFYYSFPDNKKTWYSTIKNFALGNLNTFNLSLRELFEMLEKKDSSKKEELPRIVSEFGTWGLSDPLLWTGNWYRYPVFNGENVKDKMEGFINPANTKGSIFESQWKQFWTLKYQIETMRLYPQISGYVITQLTDLSWEANGILDFDRNPKIFTNYLKWLNSEVLPLYFDGKVFISNISSRDFEGELSISGSIKKKIEIYIPAFSTLEVLELNEQNICFLQLEVCEKLGKIVGKNFYYFFPNVEKENKIEIIKTLDDNVLKEVENGETIIFKPSIGNYLNGKLHVVPSNSIAYTFSGYKTDWQGNWIGAFYYFHPVLKELFPEFYGVLKLSNYLSDKVILIDEIKNKEKHVFNVLIGKYIGWNFAECAYLVEINFGKGKLLITTLNIENSELLNEILEKLILGGI